MTKGRKKTKSDVFFSQVEEILEEGLDRIRKQEPDPRELPVDIDKLQRIASSKAAAFRFMMAVVFLLNQLQELSSPMKLTIYPYRRELGLKLTCSKCSIRESVQLSTMINNFVAQKLADMLHLDDVEYEMYSRRFLIEVEPEYHSQED